MQKPTNRQHRARHGIALLLGCTLSIVAAGCDTTGEPDAERIEARSVKVDGSEAQCVRLMAGQHHHAGSVCVHVEHDADTSAYCGAGSTGKLVVTYSTHEGWELYEEHLAVGEEYGDIPKNNGGNPQPGQFPYHNEDAGGHISHSFYVPLCELGIDGSDHACDPVTAYFAAHAVVKKYHGNECQEETAWGEGPSLGNNWSMYFTHVLSCDHEPC